MSLKFSTKSKAIILILGLFILFFIINSYVVYKDINANAQINQQILERQISNIYQATIEQTTQFYTNRAYANLNSQGVQESIISQNKDELFNLSKKRWNVLKNENTYLLDMRFYDKNLNLLTNLSQKPTSQKLNSRLKNIQKPLANFYLDKHEFTYNVLVPIKQNEKFFGILEFVLSANFFIQEIENFSNLRGYIFIDNKIYQKDSEVQNGDYVLAFTSRDKPHESICNVGLQTHEDYFLENKYYRTHVFDLKSYIDTNVGKFLFLQDITEQKERPMELFYFNATIALVLLIVFYIILNYSFNSLLKNTNIKIPEAKKEVKKEKENKTQEDLILMQQSKLTNMAAMINNVSSQWKEPLLEINSTLVNLGILYKKDEINSDKFIREINKCEHNIAFIARNIDDFSNFFAHDQEKMIFNVNDICKRVLNFLEVSFKQNKIDISFFSNEEIFINAYPNQFAQAIINILNNAIEILTQREIQEPRVSVKISKENNRAKIQIQDNAGGIKFEPIEQIFEPYTSSKTSKNAVGIGLFMSKMLIETNANGALNAKNTQDGALFEIIL